MSFGDPWFYIVLLGIAAVVYAMLLPTRKSAIEPADKGIGELESTLEHYMSEVEKENDELIDLVSQMKQDFASKQLAQQEQIVELRKRIVEVEQASRHSSIAIKAEEAAAVETVHEAAAPLAPIIAQEAVISTSIYENTQASILADDQPNEDSVVLDAKAPESVRDRYPELFDLYEKGKSIDMIAKAIGVHRGEIQLILQLAKREEA
ncbi:hypothetical protein D3C74_316360 [compost metagenome]